MAKRTDANQAAIVQALRKVGATVQRHGCPDLLVAYHGHIAVLEVKSAKGTLTKDEARWWDAWQSDVQIVRSEDEALRAIGAIR